MIDWLTRKIWPKEHIELDMNGCRKSTWILIYAILFLIVMLLMPVLSLLF